MRLEHGCTRSTNLLPKVQATNAGMRGTIVALQDTHAVATAPNQEVQPKRGCGRSGLHLATY
jgi:hypothetical protein